MDAYATGSVSSSVVVKYIEEHAKTVDQLKNDVLKEMSEKRDLESRFNSQDTETGWYWVNKVERQ